MADGDVILVASQVTKTFGRFAALGGVDLILRQGERRALIGPNGAGKTTFINVIGGQLGGGAGSVVFEGREIGGRQPYEIARAGIARTFQISRTFRRLTVYENMIAAQVCAAGDSYSLSTARLKAQDAAAYEALASVGLDNLADVVVDEISHGDRKRLEFAMAMTGEPRLLLLDEPTAGMGLGERKELMDLVQRHVAERGITLLFVEHDIDVVFRVAETITVMARGRVFAEGPPEEIAVDKTVQDIYLGTGHAQC